MPFNIVDKAAQIGAAQIGVGQHCALHVRPLQPGAPQH
jgi:hypothetical protein